MTSSNQSSRCSTLSEALTVVTERYGTEVLNGKKPLYSIISDFLTTSSPQGKQSLNLLKNAVQVGIPARIYGSITADQHTQRNTLAICKKLLIDNYGTSDEAAEEFVNSFAVALKWEVIEKKPAPKPTQANTVTATKADPEPPKKPVTPPPAVTQQNTDKMERIGLLTISVSDQNISDVICTVHRYRGRVDGNKTDSSGGMILMILIPELEFPECKKALDAVLFSGYASSYVYDHDEKMPKNLAERLAKGLPLYDDPIKKNISFSDDANSENLKNGGRVAYYDGCYYYSDYKAKSILKSKVGIWKLDMKTQKKELIITAKAPISAINIVDGWLYGFHHCEQPNRNFTYTYGKIFRMNLNKLDVDECLCEKIYLGHWLEDCCKKMLQHYNGWLFFATSDLDEKSHRNMLWRMRPDGSWLEAIAKNVGEINSISCGKICYSDTSRNKALHLVDLDGKNHLLLDDDTSSYFTNTRCHGDKLYGLSAERDSGIYKIAFAPIKQNTSFSVYKNTHVDNCHAVINIFKGWIYYLKASEVRKANPETNEDELIAPFPKEFCSACIGLTVFDDWIFLDAGEKGLYAISHDGKEIREICS